jgi:Flp pilus assembly protein TadD
VHYARGDALQNTQDYAQAKIEFERAVELRPRDYYLWVVLGVTRDADGDREGALRALRQAVALAPTYARPRWQLGNVLLRMGQIDEAFLELRKAAHSDPTVLPVVIDLAWGIYGHDAQSVATVLQPENDSIRLALALFFARHNQPAAAAEQFLLTKGNADTKGLALLDELLKTRAFSDAYQVWARMRGVGVTDPVGVFVDGDFEGWLASGQAGFGWQIAPSITNVEMSVDTSERHSGSRSLHIEFRGNSNPAAPLLTQLIMVKPQTRYRISFAASSKDFVSAASPIVTIIDVSDSKNPTLAQSPPLAPDKSGWRSFTLDLTTNATTRAIVISVARQNCANDPCPAFGALWLDSFNLDSAAR